MSSEVYDLLNISLYAVQSRFIAILRGTIIAVGTIITVKTTMATMPPMTTSLPPIIYLLQDVSSLWQGEFSLQCTFTN